jgi:hypothetical protein
MTESEILQRLQVIENEADRILKLFEVDGQVPLGSVDQAQILFQTLKRTLGSEYKRMVGKGRAKLSVTEFVLYEPAITDAWISSGIRGVLRNSQPSGKWIFALYGVKNYIGHRINNFKSRNQQAKSMSASGG